MSDLEIEVNEAVLQLVEKYGLYVHSYDEKRDANEFLNRYYTLKLKDNINLITLVVALLSSSMEVTCILNNRTYKTEKPILLHDEHFEALHKHIFKAIEHYEQIYSQSSLSHLTTFLNTFLQEARHFLEEK